MCPKIQVKEGIKGTQKQLGRSLTLRRSHLSPTNLESSKSTIMTTSD